MKKISKRNMKKEKRSMAYGLINPHYFSCGGRYKKKKASAKSQGWWGGGKGIRNTL